MLAGEYATTDQLEKKGTKDEGTAGGGDWEELRWFHMCTLKSWRRYDLTRSWRRLCLSLSGAEKHPKCVALTTNIQSYITEGLRKMNTLADVSLTGSVCPSRTNHTGPQQRITPMRKF